VQNAYDRARGGKQAGKGAQIHEELDAVLKATCALEAAREAPGVAFEGKREGLRLLRSEGKKRKVGPPGYATPIRLARSRNWL
jgi:hypothetical protein